MQAVQQGLAGLNQIVAAVRPGSTVSELGRRLQNQQDAIAQGVARGQQSLSTSMRAIVSLPMNFLQSGLDQYFPPNFRVQGPRNPSGCWFKSYGEGGGYNARRQAGQGHTEHRDTYQQWNLTETPVPAGSGQGPWNGNVVGCQPR